MGTASMSTSSGFHTPFPTKNEQLISGLGSKDASCIVQGQERCQFLTATHSQLASLSIWKLFDYVWECAKFVGSFLGGGLPVAGFFVG